METPWGNCKNRACQAERGGAAPADTAGAPPSNRAPDSCNTGVYSVLSRHVDTLDLTYRGRLHQRIELELANLKHLAQSREDAYQALAQFVMGEQVFSVHDKGYRLFRYVLHNDLFRITLAGASAEQLPMAVCQVRNYALMSMGPERCEGELRELLSELGELSADAVVGRVDLAVDFTTSDDMEAFGRQAWVTRIRSKRKHADGERYTGWDVGAHGDPASFGLYDKTLEVGLSGVKAYMHEIWERAGHVPWETVWRAEARFRRDYLRRFSLKTLPEVLRGVPALWKEFTANALRLTVPIAGDQTRSRWPDHPLWDFLQAVDWGTPFEPLSRVPRKVGAPSNDYFGRTYCALLSGLMGRDALLDLATAREVLWQIGRQYLTSRRPYLELPIEEMLIERARAKGRRYGTMVNKDQRMPAPPLTESAAARAYREGSRGR